MISRASPGSTPVPFFLHAYTPVSSENRLGVHVADVECASVNRTPSAASRSRFGVFTPRAP